MQLRLQVLLTLTDLLFIIYWMLAIGMEAGVVQISAEWMYADYNNPRVVAWNWSFFPLDVAFSIVGLASVRAARKKNIIWLPLAIISLTLTMTAGGMAVVYWALLGEFDPAWFLPNTVLLIWPVFFLPSLVARRGQVE